MTTTFSSNCDQPPRTGVFLILAVGLGLAGVLAGCAGEETVGDEFHTSGSREADQRADQRVTKVQQMRGEGEGQAGDDAKPKPSLYERLGGDEALRRIVDDFIERAIADPRVNWERKGVRRGGVLGIGSESAEWKATPDRLAKVKLHMQQFLAVATGGPAKYDGRGMKELHAGMQIANPEFDATVGAMQASLDRLGVATAEQKELLAILESTRPQVAEKR